MEELKQAEEGWLDTCIKGSQDEVDLMWKTTPSKRLQGRPTDGKAVRPESRKRNKRLLGEEGKGSTSES